MGNVFLPSEMAYIWRKIAKSNFATKCFSGNGARYVLCFKLAPYVVLIKDKDNLPFWRPCMKFQMQSIQTQRFLVSIKLFEWVSTHIQWVSIPTIRILLDFFWCIAILNKTLTSNAIHMLITFGKKIQGILFLFIFFIYFDF